MPSPEIKRGGPFPDAFEHLETQKVKPFPTWRCWRYRVEEIYGISFKDGDTPVEIFLHKLYVIRRRFQIAGKINPEEMEKFWQEAEDAIPDFATEYHGPINFIMEKTKIGAFKVKTRK